VYALEADDRIRDVIDDTLESGFSRFPVYEHKLDDVLGVVHARDLLVKLRTGNEQALVREAMRPPLVVPETSPAADLLPLFRKSQQHMAIVVGELGTVEGIVTLEDVLEEIVGEIADEYDDSTELPIVRRDDGSFLIEGRAPIDDVADELNLRELPESGGFDTLAGLILSLMGRIPRTGEHVDWAGWRFEVVDMDGLRIDKVLVSPENQELKTKN
jgi:putative hemolysin